MLRASRRAQFRGRVTGRGLYITLGYVNPEGASLGPGKGRVR